MDTIGYTQGSSSRMSSGKGGCSHQGLVLSLSPVLLSQPSPAPPLHTLAYLLTASAPPPPIHPARTVQTSDPSFRGMHLCLGRSWAWLLQSKEPWNCYASPASPLSSRRPVQLLLRLFSVEFHCLSSLQGGQFHIWIHPGSCKTSFLYYNDLPVLNANELST